MATVSLSDILNMLQKIIDLEGKVEEAIKSEKDKKRRKAIAKAFKDRDCDALRKLLFDL
jgi:lipid II:glycine glycyltransferase (peptidoglycan interpeptide bridge formation enzyme)